MKKIILLMLAGALYSPVGIAETDGTFVRNVQDVLPDTAELLKAELTKDRNDSRPVAGTESTNREPMTWNPYEQPVSCKRINAVHFWPARNRALLRLANCQYGCNYFPRPQKPGRSWLGPGMLVAPITQKESEALAKHCSVDFVKRQ